MFRLGVALAALTLAAAPASAQSFSNLFVFGDSLVDAGNARIARLASGGQDPAPSALGYLQGRFANGLNFADFLSQDLFDTNTLASLRVAPVSPSAARSSPESPAMRARASSSRSTCSRRRG